MKKEAGLHQFERRFKEKASRNGKEIVKTYREIVRVDVIRVQGEPDPGFMRQVKTKIHAMKPSSAKMLKRAKWSVDLFHEESVRSLHGCTDGERPEAVERMQKILFALVNAVADPGTAKIVRSYHLGIAPRVKDYVTDKSTSRVDQVLKGNMGILMIEKA